MYYIYSLVLLVLFQSIVSCATLAPSASVFIYRALFQNADPWRCEQNRKRAESNLIMLKKIMLIFSMLAGFAPIAEAKERTIHVLVALADNLHQGIVPVPAAIGNGQDPKNNLYWGARFGIKSFFNRQKEWRLVLEEKNPEGPILERLVYKNVQQDVYLTADAYDGRFIRLATEDFLSFASGRDNQSLPIGGRILKIGGDADLIVYVGHNGLMDFSVETEPAAMEQRTGRQAAVFACKSQSYFSKPLKDAGIAPVLLTTQFMAPEAYVVHALANGWAQGETPATIRRQVAAAYSLHQKLANPALKMFATEFAGD